MTTEPDVPAPDDPDPSLTDEEKQITIPPEVEPPLEQAPELLQEDLSELEDVDLIDAQATDNDPGGL